MINPQFLQDIKAYPRTLKEGIKIANKLEIRNLKFKITNVLVCGMGGSTMQIDLINDILANENETFRLDVNKSYSLPRNIQPNTLIILISNSGNTEEVLECLKEAEKRNLVLMIFTAGGKLLEKAESDDIPLFRIPTDLQSRLTTGYFTSGLMQILTQLGLIKDYSKMIIKAAENLDKQIDENLIKKLAKRIKNKVPIIYSTSEYSSVPRIAKIKFNETAKTQAFFNEFPELNHNEMVGFTNLLMDPFFLIFQFRKTHKRNEKRIQVFKSIMKDKEIDLEIIKPKGQNIFEEFFNAYYFIDHLSFYLSQEYGIDPEPVTMVDRFKKKLN